MGYLGMIAWVSGFCNSLATLCAPLYAILSELNGQPKNTPVVFDRIQQEAFDKLNVRLQNLEKLTVPGLDRELSLYCDSSLVTLNHLHFT